MRGRESSFLRNEPYQAKLRLPKRNILYFVYLVLIILILTACRTSRPDDTAEADSYGSFTMETTYSFDHQYYAIQEAVKYEEDDPDYIEISVYNAETEELADVFTVARARDFWGICWESDTYNIWVQSGDIGNICYKYEDGQWTRDDSAERPDGIISKYD